MSVFIGLLFALLAIGFMVSVVKTKSFVLFALFVLGSFYVGHSMFKYKYDSSLNNSGKLQSKYILKK